MSAQLTTVLSPVNTLLDQDFLPDYTDSDDESEQTKELTKLETQVWKADDNLTEGKPIQEDNRSRQCSSRLSAQLEADSRSVYVSNVDYSAKTEKLSKHFHGCGAVNRLNILSNKFTGRPKGCAYIEFANKDSVDMALMMEGTFFKGRQLKVSPKRTNVPRLNAPTSRIHKSVTYTKEEKSLQLTYGRTTNKQYYRSLYRWSRDEPETFRKSTRNYYSKF